VHRRLSCWHEMRVEHDDVATGSSERGAQRVEVACRTSQRGMEDHV